jgi:hypothetical protein
LKLSLYPQSLVCAVHSTQLQSPSQALLVPKSTVPPTPHNLRQLGSSAESLISVIPKQIASTVPRSSAIPLFITAPPSLYLVSAFNFTPTDRFVSGGAGGDRHGALTDAEIAAEEMHTTNHIDARYCVEGTNRLHLSQMVSMWSKPLGLAAPSTPRK